MKIWALLALVAAVALGVAGNRLYQAGYAACGAEHAAALAGARSAALRAAELASEKEAERLAAEASRALLAAELEDLANADPVGATECFSADRVRRLNLR